MSSGDRSESARQHGSEHSLLRYLQGSARTLLLFLDRGLAQPRVCGGILLVVLFVALLTEIGSALVKPFWFDELLTVQVSSMRSLWSIWNALNMGVDGMPVTYHWLTGKISLLPLDPHLAFRCLSILGYLMALLGTYAFVGARYGPTLALAAVLLLSLSPFETYAIEARSYALLVGLLAVAAALWQRIDERRWLAIPFCSTLALAVASHHLAIVALGCFGGAELVTAILYRKIRWRVWASLALSIIPFLVSLPMLLRYQATFGENFWSKPTWNYIVYTYGVLDGISAAYSLAFIVFAGIAAVATAISLDRTRAPEQTRSVHGFEVPEIVLSIGFLLYPAVLVTLLKVQHSGYTSRYAWPLIIGFVFTFIFVFRARTANSHATWLVCALLLVFLGRDGRAAIMAWSDTQSASQREQASFAQRVGGLRVGTDPYKLEADMPIVIAHLHEYVRASYYLNPPLSKRLWYLADAQAATRLSGTDTGDKNIEILGQVFPLQARVESASAFIAEHKSFLVWAKSESRASWLPRFLLEKGFRMELISEGDQGPIYLAVHR